MSGLAPAIRWLAALRARPWTTAEAAVLASCDHLAARAYLRRLAGQGVLVEDGDDRWRPGPQAAAWRRRRPKTREGGNSAAYRAAKALREKLAAEDWKMAREGGDLTGTSTDTMRQCPPGGDNVATQIKRTVSYLSLGEAAAMLGISKRTMERQVASGQIRTVRASARLVRVAADELDRYLAERLQA